jgi:phosphoribosylanthranilate isomerase
MTQSESVVRPSYYWLNVSSGVEFAPGRKDSIKVRVFIAAGKAL